MPVTKGERNMSDKDTDRGREERIRKMDELLLQEQRGILRGVLNLFALLLAVAFTRRFTELSSYQKDLYFAALLSTAFCHRLLNRPDLPESVAVAPARQCPEAAAGH